MTSKKKRKGTSKYRVPNWPQYEEGLIARGDITFWFSKDAAKAWYNTATASTVGAQKLYSDLAIQVFATIYMLYKQPLRQTEGFLNSIIRLMGLNISSPDHTTISRRLASIELDRPSLKRDEPITVLIDSTGLQIFTSGEWSEVKHKTIRKKEWRKLHIGIDENTKEIVASTLSSNKVSDGSQVLPLLSQVESDVKAIKADGAYDSDPLRKQLKQKRIGCITPPRKDAVLSSDADTNPTDRDKAILRIAKDGREIWEYSSGYSKRNLGKRLVNYTYRQPT